MSTSSTIIHIPRFEISSVISGLTFFSTVQESVSEERIFTDDTFDRTVVSFAGLDAMSTVFTTWITYSFVSITVLSYWTCWSTISLWEFGQEFGVVTRGTLVSTTSVTCQTGRVTSDTFLVSGVSIHVAWTWSNTFVVV